MTRWRDEKCIGKMQFSSSHKLHLIFTNAVAQHKGRKSTFTFAWQPAAFGSRTFMLVPNKWDQLQLKPEVKVKRKKKRGQRSQLTEWPLAAMHTIDISSPSLNGPTSWPWTSWPEEFTITGGEGGTIESESHYHHSHFHFLTYLPIRETWINAFRVGAVLKSTRHRYRPSSSLRMFLRSNFDGFVCGSKSALAPKPRGGFSDQNEALREPLASYLWIELHNWRHSVCVWLKSGKLPIKPPLDMTHIQSISPMF